MRNLYGGVILNEEIWHRDEVEKITQEFQIMLDYFKKGDNLKKHKSTDLNKRFSSNLNNIAKLIDKLMNVDLRIIFDQDTKLNRLSYGMCIWCSTAEMAGKLRDAIAKKNEGFYLRNCKGSQIWMDMGFWNLVLVRKLTAKHLTAVLLHELGHKVYVKSQNEILASSSAESELLNIIVCGISLTIPIALGGSIIGLACAAIGLIISGGITSVMQTKGYVGSESKSDSVAVSYGYGAEIYEVLDLFYSLTQYRGKKFMKVFNTIFNKVNSSKMRRDNVIKFLEQELNDPKNSKREKENLKKLIDELKKRNEESDKALLETVDGTHLMLLSYVE